MRVFPCSGHTGLRFTATASELDAGRQAADPVSEQKCYSKSSTVCRPWKIWLVAIATNFDCNAHRYEGQHQVLYPSDLKSCYFLMISAYVPRPIALVSSRSAAGVGNVAPYSYSGCVGHDPPTLVVSCCRKPDGRSDAFHYACFYLLFAMSRAQYAFELNLSICDRALI